MPRLLVNDRWYDPISGANLYENDYETALVQHSHALFPGFHCVPFKALVDSEFGRSKPDLALIDFEYRMWHVVEVELDTHPLRQHVEEQVRKLAHGDYGLQHAEQLNRADGRLELPRLVEMMRGEQPSVLVLVTRNMPEWHRSLAQYGASVGVIELFRDDRDHMVLRVNGDQPTALDSELVTRCTAHRSLSRALLVHSPGPFSGKDQVDLLYAGTSTRWNVVRAQDMVFLMPSERLGMNIVGGSKWEVRKMGSNFVLSEEGK